MKSLSKYTSKIDSWSSQRRRSSRCSFCIDCSFTHSVTNDTALLRRLANTMQVIAFISSAHGSGETKAQSVVKQSMLQCHVGLMSMALHWTFVCSRTLLHNALRTNARWFLLSIPRKQRPRFHANHLETVHDLLNIWPAVMELDHVRWETARFVAILHNPAYRSGKKYCRTSEFASYARNPTRTPNLAIRTPNLARIDLFILF